MSLRVRLLVSIAASLLLAAVAGFSLLCWHARESVAQEVRTAFEGALSTARDTLRSDVQHTVTMRQVIASFNGQRHVRARLVNEQGRVVVISSPAPPAADAPAWFARLIAPPPLFARVPVALPHYPCTVELQSDARNEVSEVWAYARGALATMTLFCAATLLLAWLVIGRALRFFGRLEHGLKTVSDGDYAARLDTRGPPEFSALARGFNHMAERLAAFAEGNRKLERQILTLEEEERAGIARDLHDEVGPYLFAIQVDADALGRAGGETRARALAIREAALHIQRHVKEILRQLKPATGLEFGLRGAIADLVAFWSRRRPEIEFRQTVADGLVLGGRQQDAIYRIVQESLSNAVRHGEPRAIRIAVLQSAQGVRVCVEDDGLGLKAGFGMGLTGMAERVRALDGRLTVEDMDSGGVRVTALLPPARMEAA